MTLDGAPVPEISPMQGRILAEIKARAGDCVTIDELGRALCPQSADPGNVIRVQTYRIRCVSLRYRTEPPIKNIYGKGYRWAE